MKKIAVLLSGGGSNFQAVIDACESGMIDGKIVMCVSSKQDAFGLERAKKHGIESAVLARTDFDSSEKLNESLVKLLKSKSVDLVVLAGYLSILTQITIDNFKNAIINVHPSLIPSFCGKGYYGIKVHEAVLAYGAKVSGATVHFVDEGTDTGAIIFQEAVPVLFDDTPEKLQKRVLEVEHKLLPLAVKLFCEDNLVIEGGRLCHIKR